MADTWEELTMPFSQAYTPLDELAGPGAPTILAPNDPRLIAPRSSAKRKVTGPGVLGGVGSMGAVNQQSKLTSLASALVNQAPYGTAVTNKPTKGSFLNPQLGFSQGGYDLRNASISPGSIQKALSNPDRPTNAAPPPPPPDLTDYTEPGYTFMNYFD